MVERRKNWSAIRTCVQVSQRGEKMPGQSRREAPSRPCSRSWALPGGTLRPALPLRPRPALVSNPGRWGGTLAPIWQPARLSWRGRRTCRSRTAGRVGIGRLRGPPSPGPSSRPTNAFPLTFPGLHLENSRRWQSCRRQTPTWPISNRISSISGYVKVARSISVQY